MLEKNNRSSIIKKTGGDELMNIEKVLEELDGLFAQHKVDEVEPFLLQKIDEASKEGDTASMITLLNEIIGH